MIEGWEDQSVRRGGEEGRPTMFLPEDDNIVPGEVIFAVEANAASAITARISDGPIRGQSASMGAIGQLGAGIDGVLAGLKVDVISHANKRAPTVVDDG